MSEAPERIFICRHVGEYGSYYPEAVEAEGEYGGEAVEYVRADQIDAIKAQVRRETLQEAAKACTNVIKNYDVMEPGKPGTFASLKTQKAAKGMVSLAREDILTLISQKDKDA